MNQVCEQVFEEQLKGIVDIRAVFDFNNFLHRYRPRSADKKIRKQFAFTFEARADDKIVIRTKKNCGAGTPWSVWYQILPFPGVDADVVHAPDVIPRMAAPKAWPELREMTPKLTKFYERAFAHPVDIPERDLHAMRKQHTHAHMRAHAHLSLIHI